MKTVITLDNAAFLTDSIVGVGKGEQPATLQTHEVPYLSIFIAGQTTPIVLMYETVERRDEEYEAVLEAMTTLG